MRPIETGMSETCTAPTMRPVDTATSPLDPTIVFGIRMGFKGCPGANPGERRSYRK